MSITQPEQNMAWSVTQSIAYWTAWHFVSLVGKTQFFTKTKRLEVKQKYWSDDMALLSCTFLCIYIVVLQFHMNSMHSSDIPKIDILQSVRDCDQDFMITTIWHSINLQSLKGLLFKKISTDLQSVLDADTSLIHFSIPEVSIQLMQSVVLNINTCVTKISIK